MKKNIHPKIHPVIFKFANGKEIKARSVLGKSDQEIVITVGDWPLETHQAWTKSQSTNIRSTTKIKKFQDKFGGNLFGGSVEE